MSMVKIRFQVSLLISFIFSACGPSQAELISTATQVAANTLANQTAQAPTATPTFTPSPTAAMTPTATPSPTATATPTTTPSPSPTADFTAREKELIEEVNTLLEVEDNEGAVELCTEALNADPDFAMAYILRGVNLFGLFDFEAAVGDFNQAIELGIDDDLDKEFEPEMTVKTIYYFRGFANMALGAVQQGIEDFERFLEVTESFEYPELRASAQQLIEFEPEPVPVSSSHRFDFPLYSILAPQGQGLEVEPIGDMSIMIGRLDKLSDGEGIYSELTTVAVSDVDYLEMDYSDEEFMQFACSFMDRTGDRRQTLHEQCDWWVETSFDCVFSEGLHEDYGTSDNPFSPPLIMESQSLVCRHPNFSDVIIFLHYSQRGPEGRLEDNIDQQADAFFQGLSFNQPKD